MEDEIKKFKQMVFWVGLVVIFGANSTGIFTVLYPGRVEQVVRPDKFTETMFIQRMEIYDLEIRDYIDDRFLELESNCQDRLQNHLNDGENKFRELKITLAEFRVRIDECLRRTMYK